MVGATMDETGGEGDTTVVDDPDESTEHQFDSEFAIGTVIEDRPRDRFAEFDNRMRELNDQIETMRRRLGLMGATLLFPLGR